MNQGHECGRGLSVAMQGAIARGQMSEFVMYADQYVRLLSEHIDKESRWLFEKAEQILSDDEDEEQPPPSSISKRRLSERRRKTDVRRQLKTWLTSISTRW